MRKTDYEIISEWKNKEYPGKIFCIVMIKRKALGLMDKTSLSLFGPDPPLEFIEYEKLLWSEGWRKEYLPSF